MNKEDGFLIGLFLIVIVFGAFLLLYDPSSIGKRDNETQEKTQEKPTIVAPQEPTQKPIIPQDLPSGLSYNRTTKPNPQPEPQPEPEFIPEPEPNNTQPPSQQVLDLINNETKTTTTFTPKVQLPKTVTSINQVSETMCEFRDSVMDNVAETNNQYYCICQNGYGRIIGNI